MNVYSASMGALAVASAAVFILGLVELAFGSFVPGFVLVVLGCELVVLVAVTERAYAVVRQMEGRN